MRKFNFRNLMLAMTTFIAALFVGCNTEDVDYDTPYITLDKTTETFPATYTTKEITLESNRPWKVTSIKSDGKDVDWVKILPSSGDGNATISVTVLDNDGEESIDRTADVVISTATVSAYLRINQEGAISTTDIFQMNFGTAATEPWPKVDAYTDWGASGSGYSATGTTFASTGATLRSNSVSSGYTGASGGTNCYMSYNYDFVINGITIPTGINKFNISFGSAYYSGVSGGTDANLFKPEYISVEISSDGGANWTPMTYTATPTSNDQRWALSSGSVVLPTAPSAISVRFKGTLASGQLRIDDIKIVGMEVAPPTEPTVITNAASSISATGATLNGQYNFGTAATEVGFEYKKTADATYTSIVGTGSVGFSATLTGLTASTGYTFRAYAVYAGTTYYGGEQTFTTSDAASGTLIFNETLGTPTATTAVDAYTGWGTTGPGAAGVTFSASSTQVTVRTSSASTGYDGATGGGNIFFGTGSPTSFTINGIRTGGATHFTLGFAGFYYSAPLSASEIEVSYATSETGTYTAITLPFGTAKGWQYMKPTFTVPAGTSQIWLKFTAKVDSQVRIDDISLYTTDTPSFDPVPVVTTADATGIGDNAATVGGSYTYTGNQTISEAGVAYKLNTEENYTTKAASATTSPFTVALSGLTTAGTYTYKAYVKIGTEITYGAEKTFTTTGQMPTVTIASIRTAAVNGDPTPNSYIVGTVVSDKTGTNLQKYQFALVDGTSANSGVMVNISDGDNTYALGDKVKVSLKGGSYNIYNGLIQLKVAAANITTDATAPGSTTPVNITADQLTNYESMLVKVTNTCQVAADQLEQTMNSGSTGNNGNVNIVTSDNKTFVMRTASSAAFTTQPVPQLSGTMIGIPGRYNTSIQLSPRTMADLSAMTQPRFGGITFQDPSFTATTANSGVALVDGKIVIPYAAAAGSESYSASVAVTGTLGTIPATITKTLTISAAGNGNLEIPVTGTPAAGEVTFTITGVGSTALSCKYTFTPPVTGTVFTAAWNTNGLTNAGEATLAPTVTPSTASVTIGNLTKNNIGAATAGNVWGGNAFNNNTADNLLTAPSAHATFTVTSTKSFSISNINYYWKRSSTGPTKTSVQYQLGTGSFVQIEDREHTGSSTTLHELTTGGVTALQNIPANTIVTIRFVPYNTTSATGTWYIDDAKGVNPFGMQLKGSVN